jgi:hypothetical protein
LSLISAPRIWVPAAWALSLAILDKEYEERKEFRWKTADMMFAG